MKKFFAFALVAGALCFSSCTTVTPIAATSNPVGNKCGMSKSVRVFNIFGGNANMGINAAAKKGGISKISHVDLKTTNWGLWVKQTVMVYGE